MAAQEAPALLAEFDGADPGSIRFGHVWLQVEGETRSIGTKLGEYTLVCSLSPLPGRLDAPLLPT